MSNLSNYKEQFIVETSTERSIVGGKMVFDTYEGAVAYISDMAKYHTATFEIRKLFVTNDLDLKQKLK